MYKYLTHQEVAMYKYGVIHSLTHFRRSFVYPHRCAPGGGVGFSTLSTGRFVLKQYICKGAESAEHAETAGYTYEGTPTTA